MNKKKNKGKDELKEELKELPKQQYLPDKRLIITVKKAQKMEKMKGNDDEIR